MLLADFQPIEILFFRFVMGFLALLAVLLWTCHSILTRKISDFGYHTIQMTRRVFYYGILFMIPALFFFDFKLDLRRFANLTYLLNIIFLGLGLLRSASLHGIMRLNCWEQ